MRRIKLTTEFDGTNFYGWQLQARTGERTVQGVIETALAKIPNTKPRVIGAGRTDAGVHALAMAAHYDTEDSIPTEKISKALNAHLPPDVRILKAEEVGPNFHAQYDCYYRRYVYRMRLTRNSFASMAFDHKRVLFLSQKLDILAMKKAAKNFLGKRDFASLATQETRGTVREIYLCELEQQDNDLNLHLVANGFLRNMVRTIVGTLLCVGEGKLKPNDIQSILVAKNRAKAGPNVAPHGLYFAEASYIAWQG